MDIKSLKPKDKKILKAALKCGEQKLTVKALSELAGVKPEYVCEKMRNPEFRELFIEALHTAVTAETPAILHSFTQAAKEGSFQHGKLILELTGVHQDKQKIDLNAKIESSEALFKTDEEKAAFMEATFKRVSKGEN